MPKIVVVTAHYNDSWFYANRYSWNSTHLCVHVLTHNSPLSLNLPMDPVVTSTPKDMVSRKIFDDVDTSGLGNVLRVDKHVAADCIG